MSYERSFMWERIRINIEIFCESIVDSCRGSPSMHTSSMHSSSMHDSSGGGGIKKPLMFLAGIAVIMTLRSARRGVQRMKYGGLTAGAHDPRYRAAYGSSSSSKSKSSSVGNRLTSTFGSSGSSGYNGKSGYSNGYSSGSSSYGSSSSSSSSPYSSSSGNNSPGSSSSSYGSSSYGSSSYGSSSGSYSSSSSSSFASGGMSNGQSPRPVADLVEKHGPAVRVLSESYKFRDFGGTHEFYGQVETLTATEGAGVVEKVLQSPGNNKVLVVDGSGSTTAGIYGKTAAQNAKQNGWKGVVINGVVLNVKDIGGVAVGCKALGANPNRGRATSGSKGTTLNFGGQSISSGMWIYVDKDGIAVSDSELRTDGTSSSSSSGGYTGSSASTSSSSGSSPYSSGSSSGYNSGGYNTGGYNTGSSSGGYNTGSSSNNYNSGSPQNNGYGGPGSGPGGNSGGYGGGYNNGGYQQGGYDNRNGQPPPGYNNQGYGGGGSGGNSYPYSHRGYSGSASMRVFTALLVTLTSLILLMAC